MHYFICIGLVALLLPASAYDIAPPSDIDRDYWKPFEVSGKILSLDISATPFSSSDSFPSDI